MYEAYMKDIQKMAKKIEIDPKDKRPIFTLENGKRYKSLLLPRKIVDLSNNKYYYIEYFYNMIMSNQMDKI